MDISNFLESKNKIFIDGGTGSEVERLGGQMSNAWGALANIHSPDVVLKVHEGFINAGCDIITTNTFATCRHTLQGPGSEDKTLAINQAAVKLAKQAVKNTNKENKVLIAGSMTNFFALSENEYRPDPRFLPSLSDEEKCDFYHLDKNQGFYMEILVYPLVGKDNKKCLLLILF